MFQQYRKPGWCATGPGLYENLTYVIAWTFRRITWLTNGVLVIAVSFLNTRQAVKLIIVQRLGGHRLHTTPVCGTAETPCARAQTGTPLHTTPVCGTTETNPPDFRIKGALHTTPVCGTTETLMVKWKYPAKLHTTPVCGTIETPITITYLHNLVAHHPGLRYC